MPPGERGVQQTVGDLRHLQVGVGRPGTEPGRPGEATFPRGRCQTSAEAAASQDRSDTDVAAVEQHHAGGGRDLIAFAM
ncbi:hypothetical protein Val02_30920 [Virgisporangium aliadipatigenens]|uniref:Uncharacterized protein n=1 Tax=Virgisporangium aliadipatigenens TaxID=741659 RepID=A0A8J3YLS6_9ACTN|nr:hypothetical protein Val02_30920 [Virgisporangium aliadipatigenens]